MNLKGNRLSAALIVWIVTFAVIAALLLIPPLGVTDGDGTVVRCRAVIQASFGGPDCVGAHVETLANSLLIGFVGLALGTVLLVSRRRTHWSEDRHE